MDRASVFNRVPRKEEARKEAWLHNIEHRITMAKTYATIFGEQQPQLRAGSEAY